MRSSLICSSVGMANDLKNRRSNRQAALVFRRRLSRPARGLSLIVVGCYLQPMRVGLLATFLAVALLVSNAFAQEQQQQISPLSLSLAPEKFESVSAPP